jgi:carbon-monoxide dehydrogenase medium subunit|tara:strand:- start:378 stop:1208 length:831 start_codon:yes stop_codon:yes gene_type:complete
MATVMTDRAEVRVLRPDSAREAVTLARQHGGTYVAGATWLQPSCERGRNWPPFFIALDARWPGFRGLQESHQGLTIGALTTLDTLSHHPLMKEYLPCLTGRNGLMNLLAGPGVRRLGTLGGNLMAGGDLTALAFALDARIQLIGDDDPRGDWLVWRYPDLKSTDLISALVIPDCRRWRVAVEKLGHRERFSPTRATIACVYDGNRFRMAVCGEGGPGRLEISEAALNDGAASSTTTADWCQALDAELEGLGWHDARLRLAIRRVLVHQHEELSDGD